MRSPVAETGGLPPAAPPAPHARARVTALCSIGVIVVGVTLRVLYLDADIDYYAWIGHIIDEGRWIAHVREWVLFGHIINREWTMHLLLAPLFQLAHYPGFALAGVSMWTARLPTALAGSMLLLVFWALLRRVVSPEALFAALVLLAFEADLVWMSRVSVPEMAAMLMQLVVYAILVTGRPEPGRTFLAGLLLAIAIGTKATTLPMLIVFSVILVCQPRDPRGPTPGRPWGGLLAFYLGVLAIPAAVAPVALACCRQQMGDPLARNIGTLVSLVRPNDLYSTVSFFFQAPVASTITLWAVGVHCTFLAWLASRDRVVDPRVSRHLVASSLWCGLYGALMLSLDYFPERYRIHILVPMALNIAVGLTLLQSTGLSGLDRALGRMRRGARLASLAIIALPTAILWAPVPAVGLALAGANMTRLRVNLACIAVSLLATTSIAARAASRGRSLAPFAVFAVVGSLVWSATQRAGLGPFWPTGEAAGPSWGVLGLWIAAALTFLATRALRGWSRARRHAMIPTLFAFYALLCLIRIGPSYLSPHYSVRDASRQIGVLLREVPGVVGAASAESLFTENRVPYRTILNRTWPRRFRPDVLVSAFAFQDDAGLLPREYSLIASYPLVVSPEFDRDNAAFAEDSGYRLPVRVYRRSATGALDDAPKPVIVEGGPRDPAR